MPIDETKQASGLLVNSEEISKVEMQNRFGARHEVIRDVTAGKYLTILAVETDGIVDGHGFAALETVLKQQFGVRALQTIFGDTIPAEKAENETFNVHIMAHLRIDQTQQVILP